jgi:hypothetical protein
MFVASVWHPTKVYAPTVCLIPSVGLAEGEELVEVGGSAPDELELDDVLEAFVDELEVEGTVELELDDDVLEAFVDELEVEVGELEDEVDLTDELDELVDFVVEDEVDLTELDEDEEDLTDDVDELFADVVEVDLTDELRVDEDEVDLTDELVEVDFTDELDELVVRTTEAELVELADELAVVVVVQGGRLTRDL